MEIHFLRSLHFMRTYHILSQINTDCHIVHLICYGINVTVKVLLPILILLYKISSKFHNSEFIIIKYIQLVINRQLRSITFRSGTIYIANDEIHWISSGKIYQHFLSFILSWIYYCIFSNSSCCFVSGQVNVKMSTRV